jgi:histidinol-phosphate phosphatase family protein
MHDFYYCPHHPDGKVKLYARECECRKPKPGLLLRAARDWKIDLPSSWMIGDILDDVEAGRRAGCQTILLDNGHETEWRMDNVRQPHYRVKNIEQAAHIILSTKTDYAAV